MAIDRGGLRYEIEVITKNLASLRTLRRELKATFTAQASVTKAQLNAARRTSQLAAATARGVAAQERARAAATRTAIAEERLAVLKLRRAQLEARVAKQQERSNASTNRSTRAYDRLTRTLQKYGRALGIAGSRTRRLGRDSQSAAAKTNQLFFSLRRLVGTLAIFQAARAVAGGFRALVTSSLQFRASIEAVNIGVAGLITNIATLEDKQGRQLEGAEKFQAALKLSAEFTRQLRADSIRTTATFEELARAAQEGLAPALSQGLNLEQARKVSVLISQAATALTIPQNQLGEEIRSILSGTAGDRITRTARAFGVSAVQLNKLIKEAQAEGRLFEFITERLQGTAEAADLAALSFSGLQARVRDAVLLVGSEASLPLFEELKKQAIELIDVLVPKDEKGDPFVRPEAVQALTGLFVGLKQLAQDFKAEVSEITFEEANAGFTALGQVLRSVGGFIIRFVRGLIEGFGDVAAFVKLFQSTLEEIAGGPVPNLVVLLGRIVAITLTARTAMFLFSKTIGLVVYPALRLAVGAALALGKGLFYVATTVVPLMAKGVAKLVPLIGKTLVGAVKLFTKSWFLIPAIVAGLIVLFKEIISNLLGVSLTWKQFGDLMVLVWDNFKSKVFLVWEAIKSYFLQGFNFITKHVRNGIAAILDVAASAIDYVSSSAAEALSGAANRIRAAAQQDERELQAAKDRLEKAADEYEAKQEEINKRFDKLKDEAAKKESGEGLLDGFIKGMKADVGGALDSVFESVIGVLPEGLQQAFTEGWEKFKADQFKIEKGEGPKFDPGDDDATLVPKAPESTLTEEQKFRFVSERLKLENQIADLQRNATAQRIADLQLQLELLERQRDVVQQTEKDAQTKQAKLDVIDAKQKLTQAQLDQLGEGDADAGINAAIDNFIAKQDSFQAASDIMTNALNGFADALVDALESPEDAGEALLNFFKSIVKQILAQLARLAIAKALSAAGFGAVEGGPIGEGKVAGGMIGSHTRARGYADGGKIAGPRPAGLDPRDTVPIWAQPGEFMQPVSAVRAYGKEFMEAVRSRALPPSLMKALGSLAMGTRTPRLASRGPGYATGGQIALPATDSPSGDRLVVEVRSTDVVNDGLSRDTLRTVSPGIKEPRNVAESKGQL